MSCANVMQIVCIVFHDLQAALDLLLDLMAHDSGCLREGARLLQQAHFATANLDTLYNYQPVSTARWVSDTGVCCMECVNINASICHRQNTLYIYQPVSTARCVGN